MLGIVNAVLVIGALISALGAVLLVNLAGSGDYPIRHLTSRSLGSLPPGYAASKRGFQVYALVVLAIGLVFLGVGLSASAVTSGLAHPARASRGSAAPVRPRRAATARRRSAPAAARRASPPP